MLNKNCDNTHEYRNEKQKKKYHIVYKSEKAHNPGTPISTRRKPECPSQFARRFTRIRDQIEFLKVMFFRKIKTMNRVQKLGNTKCNWHCQNRINQIWLTKLSKLFFQMLLHNTVTHVCVYIYCFMAHGSVVGWGTCYKPEGRGFTSQWSEWIFQLT
jgi:hypothetical protein